MTPADQAFAIHKAPHVAECIARNLKRARVDQHISRLWESDDVFVIGAGHTLPDKLDREAMLALSAEADGEDPGETWATFAVNSAIGACLHRGLVPRFVVCRESIDMSHQLRQLPKGTTAAILDIGVHPNTWAAAEEHCRDVWWFIPAQTQLFGMAAHYGVEPIYGGTSNVTAAVAIAASLGSTSIKLLGCSRAFSADGRAYADGTGWESVRLTEVTEEGGRHIGTIEGTEAKAALHAASGQRPPLKRENVIPVTAVDGSTRYALETLEGDRQWLETFAARHPHLLLHQHNPDVAIRGWGHAVSESPLPLRTVDYCAEVVSQCENAESIAAAVLASEQPVAELGALTGGTELPDYHGIGDRVQIVQALRGHPSPVRIRAMMGAWREAASRVKGWVTE